MEGEGDGDWKSQMRGKEGCPRGKRWRGKTGREERVQRESTSHLMVVAEVTCQREEGGRQKRGEDKRVRREKKERRETTR